MLLIKTLKARDALQDRNSTLTSRQRQILVLTDGKRTSQYIMDLLGDGAKQDIAELMQRRYLVRADEGQDENDFENSAHGEMWDVSTFNEEQDLPSQFGKF